MSVIIFVKLHCHNILYLTKLIIDVRFSAAFQTCKMHERCHNYKHLSIYKRLPKKMNKTLIIRF